MFRNEMSGFHLFGQTSGPRPSFLPAVEALEERVVLDGGMHDPGPSPTPSPPPSPDPAPSLTPAHQAQLNRIAATAEGILQALEKTHLTDADLKSKVGQFLVQEAKLRKQINRLLRSNDPALTPDLIQDFRQLDRRIIKAATALATGHSPARPIHNANDVLDLILDKRNK